MFAKRFLIATLTVICLTGCGAHNETGEPVKPVDGLSSESDRGHKSPDIPYSDQIDTIVKNKAAWCFTVPDDAGEEYGLNESEYYYWITDMDQNGFLEVISSSTTGNGSYYDNHYYEVSQDGKGLTELKTDESEDAPAADLWSIGEYARGYYDRKTGIYHYPQYDHTHGSAVDTSDAQLDTVLADGAVTINTISFIESSGYDRKSRIVKYYSGDREEKLGEVKEPLDETAEEFAHAKKQESELGKQIEALYEKYYEGMQEFTVTTYSFRNIDEEEWEKESEISVISDEILRERIEKSWNSFGIHFPNEKAADNPFFPKTATGDAEVSYLLDMLSEGKATMKMQEELRGNDSVLYLVTYCDPREVSNREGSISEEKEKEWVSKEFEETYFYLWITDTQIYYISRFYPDEEDVGIEPDGDAILDDDYQKARLVFYHEIPEYARLVCQEEETRDTLEEGKKGRHQWIEKHGEDIRCYRSYTSKGEGYEAIDILQFVWKRGEGLIGMRYATHAAGGGGRFFWKEAYLKLEDVSFSIDTETTADLHEGFKLRVTTDPKEEVVIPDPAEVSGVAEVTLFQNNEDLEIDDYPLVSLPFLGLDETVFVSNYAVGVIGEKESVKSNCLVLTLWEESMINDDEDAEEDEDSDGYAYLVVLDYENKTSYKVETGILESQQDQLNLCDITGDGKDEVIVSGVANEWIVWQVFQLSEGEWKEIKSDFYEDNKTGNDGGNASNYIFQAFEGKFADGRNIKVWCKDKDADFEKKLNVEDIVKEVEADDYYVKTVQVVDDIFDDGEVRYSFFQNIDPKKGICIELVVLAYKTDPCGKIKAYIKYDKKADKLKISKVKFKTVRE